MRHLEIRRQLAHIVLGVGLSLSIFYGFIHIMELFVILVLTIILSFVLKKYNIPLISRNLDLLEREDHKKDFPGKGLIFFLLGSFLTLSFFPLHIAIPAILILTFGDSVSHLFGLHFGRTKHPFSDKKNLEGMLAGFLAAFFPVLLFLEWPEALVASAVAMIIEGLEINAGESTIDDNLLIPLAAAVSILLMRTIF